MIDPTSMMIERDRQIKNSILRVLYVHRESGLEIGYDAAELSNLLRDTVFGSNCGELGAKVRDLLDRRLICQVANVNPPRFVMTADGADFCRANFPWSMLDKYTGRSNA